MPQTVTARRVALLGMFVSGSLAVAKIATGWLGGSASAVADGFESASDVFASAAVWFGLTVASRPADENHPYGHGRMETLSGFSVGWILAVAGVLIALGSARGLFLPHAPPQSYAAWPLAASIVLKSVLTFVKRNIARKAHSSALMADAYNDGVDILSGTVALAALGLTLYDPARFLSADHFGGIAVGFIVIYIGLRVVYETTMQLMDTMPSPEVTSQIRQIALTVPGALGVEKCFARKTGLQYHVDLHLEVDGAMTVRESHQIASAVRDKIQQELDWVAGVLVHVEPHEM
ncbi:MAG: cation transporter [Candidatus Solibacter usitatus]|nr:cation transporter [Candidatus Solibacter usitatus]